jgi:hypothetical protein
MSGRDEDGPEEADKEEHGSMVNKRHAYFSFRSVNQKSYNLHTYGQNVPFPTGALATLHGFLP